MITAWTKHLEDADAKTKFEQYVRNSRPVLERLNELLNEEEHALDRSEMRIENYDLPNWEYRQAHKNGFRQCLSIVKKLIDLDQQKPKEK